VDRVVDGMVIRPTGGPYEGTVRVRLKLRRVPDLARGSAGSRQRAAARSLRTNQTCGCAGPLWRIAAPWRRRGEG
jgi:hypothetical protein